MKIIKDDEQRRRFGALRQLIMYMLRYKLIFACVVVVVIASNLLALVIPQLTGVIVDALVPGNVDFDVVVSNVINIALIGLASYVLSVLQNVLMLRAAQHVVVDLRHDVFQKLSRLPVSFFDGNTKGNILAILVSDIDNISDTVSSDAITLLTGMVTLVGAITMMLRISPLLTLVFAVTVPIMAAVAYFVKNRARVLFREKKNWFGRLCGYAEEMITAQKTIKVYGIEDFNEQKFDDMSEKLRAAGSKAEFASSTMMPQMNFINNLNYIGICAFGALLAVSGGISIGNISTFTLYAKKFSAPIVDTANIVNMLQATLAACDRVFSILGAESEPEQPLLPAASNSHTFPAPQDIRGEIRFEHVNFSYVKDKQVLNDISFTVKPGERIAIVGATGSGKTTIISLLMRFYECTDGRITIDGMDIREIPLATLRSYIALILQDSWLFEDTVLNNISYAAPPERREPDVVKQLCRDITVDEFICTLPNGYDTMLRADSGGLSQGQKQLMSIARTFLCDPPVFILDEATSSVDTLTERHIQRVTANVTAGKTSIIIAHRLSTIRGADRIIVMKDGTIREVGSHDELMAKNGMYADLYRSQFVEVA